MFHVLLLRQSTSTQIEPCHYSHFSAHKVCFSNAALFSYKECWGGGGGGMLWETKSPCRKRMVYLSVLKKCLFGKTFILTFVVVSTRIICSLCTKHKNQYFAQHMKQEPNLLEDKLRHSNMEHKDSINETQRFFSKPRVIQDLLSNCETAWNGINPEDAPSTISL